MKVAAVRTRAKPPAHARLLPIIMAKHSQVCPSPYECIQLNEEHQRPSIVHMMMVMSGSDQQPWLKTHYCHHVADRYAAGPTFVCRVYFLQSSVV